MKHLGRKLYHVLGGAGLLAVWFALGRPRGLLGLVLLYGNVLAILHFALMPASETDSYSLAEARLGGGYLGAFILEFLRGGGNRGA
mgnify:CR=1 FL=1